MKENTSTHFQDSPHKEGNAANTAPKGQPREGANPQSMSTMNQDSPEQLAGRNKQNEQDDQDEQGGDANSNQ
jgi:hypothetical protein